MNKLLIPVYVLMWVARFLAELTFWLVGFPLVFVLAYFKLYKQEKSMFYPYSILKWKGGWLTWLWGNEEDGIDGSRFRGVGFMLDKPMLTRIWQWSAVRNAVSNFRYLPILNPKLDPKRIKGYGNCERVSDAYIDHRKNGLTTKSAYWTFATQGLYSGFWLIKPATDNTHHRFGLGWRIYPSDAKEETFEGTARYPYSGFAIQFTWNRKDSAAFAQLQ